MANLNILLKYKLAGNAELQVKSGARIQIDGQGALIIYDSGNAAPEEIQIAQLNALCIRSVTMPSPTPIPHAA